VENIETTDDEAVSLKSDHKSIMFDVLLNHKILIQSGNVWSRLKPGLELQRQWRVLYYRFDQTVPYVLPDEFDYCSQTFSYTFDDTPC
jgi:hypothetical protein